MVERLLTLPLQSLALKVLQVDKYSSLLSFLPWGSRKQVRMPGGLHTSAYGGWYTSWREAGEDVHYYCEV